MVESNKGRGDLVHTPLIGSKNAPIDEWWSMTGLYFDKVVKFDQPRTLTVVDLNNTHTGT